MLSLFPCRMMFLRANILYLLYTVLLLPIGSLRAPSLALRVVGSDEKEPSVWGYNWATLFLENINTGTWPSMLGQSRI
jgi:hypothetical protein